MINKKRIIKGIVYTVGGSYIGKAVNLICTIALARLLSPEDFGIVALALVFVSLAGLLREFGFDFALIHRRENLEEAVPTHFFLNLSASLISFSAVIIVSVFLRKYYDTRVVYTFLILSGAIIIRSLGATSRVMLDKEMMFGKTAIIETSVNIFSLLLAVLLAWCGFGFWSLVIAGSANSIVYIFLTSICYFIIYPIHVKSIKLSWETVKWYFEYGKWMWIGGVATMIVLQFDDFIAGSLLGVAVLGLYERAYRFSQYPTDAVTHVIGKIAMSIYSNLQDQKEKLSKSFSLVLAGIVRVSIPLSTALFIFAEDIVRFLIGYKWIEFVPLLRWLVIYSLLRPIFDDTGAFFAAIGKPKIFTKVISIQAILMIIFCPLFTFLMGIKGTAMSADLVMAVGVILAYKRITGYISINYQKIFIPPIISTSVSSLITILFKTHLIENNNITTFIFSLSIYMTSYVLMVLLLERKNIKELKKYIFES